MARQQLGTAPAANLDAATKQYVDAQIAANSGSSGAMLSVAQANGITAGRTGIWIQLDSNNIPLTEWIENGQASPNRIASAGVKQATDSSLFTITNGTLSNDTTLPHEGTSSVRITPTQGAAPSWNIGTYTNGAAVTVGTAYTAIMQIYVQSFGEAFVPSIYWYNSTGGFLSQTTGNQYSVSGNAWNQLTVSGTAPTSAAYATLFCGSVYPLNSSELINIDEYGIQAGTITDWYA